MEEKRLGEGRWGEKGSGGCYLGESPASNEIEQKL